jgi:DNA-nicking Smr family endonuclease
MAGRRLSPEERAAWAAVARTVTPLRGRRITTRIEAGPPVPEPSSARNAGAEAITADTFLKAIKGRVPPLRPTHATKGAPAAPTPAPLLDGTWEKRIRTGRLEADASVDLHGLTLAGAHARLDRLLGDALRAGWCVLHVVTGKPRPAPLAGEARKRGAIRAEIGDWLGHSPYARHIASVRQAHPRHGGDGALYIILRRAGA